MTISEVKTTATADAPRTNTTGASFVIVAEPDPEVKLLTFLALPEVTVTLLFFDIVLYFELILTTPLH